MNAQSTKLALVDDRVPPAPPAEPATPAREYLKKVRARRDEAGAAMGAAVAASQRVEALIAAPAPIAHRIASLEKAFGDIIENWASRADGSPAPDMPQAEEMENLREELARAEAIAAGARAALPRLADEIVACQADNKAAAESMHRAVDAVLIDEARIFATELAAAEAQAALLMGNLTALTKHFELEARRRPDNIGPAATSVNDFVPPRPSLTIEAVTKAMSTWERFVTRLFADENATFEESHK